ncbi:hypothetical protein JYT89_02180 [Flavobacteriaceae bacterium AH-315-B10]|nr:hypothetical protein [Flavobacteriaceae bacterium AH-315-B10]
MSHAVLTVITAINELDEKQLFRKNLGDAAFTDLQPIWDEIKSKMDFIEKFNVKVPKAINDQADSQLTTIKQNLDALIGYDKSQFVAQQTTIKNAIVAQLEAIKIYWPQYAIAALEDSGLLTNTDVKQQFESLTTDLKESTEAALLKIEEQSKLIIEEAKKKAEEIESSVRKTAQNVSVKVAQEQFEEGASHNFFQIRIWGGIAIVLAIIFISFIWYLLAGVDKLPKDWNWTIGYVSIIRISILGLISAVIGFSLKMLKANLHMHQHNLHRKRLANSMAAFAESAMTNEQRDIILSQLVESVSNFGTSGMISKESNSGGISIDSITKTVLPLKGNE